GHHQAPEDNHQPCQFLVHSLEQPVKSQREEDDHGPGEQIAQDAKAEKRLMCGDVVGRRSSVPHHEQLAWNVHEAQWGGQECQVEEPCDSSVPDECGHAASPLRRIAGGTAKTVKKFRDTSKDAPGQWLRPLACSNSETSACSTLAHVKNIVLPPPEARVWSATSSPS